MEEADATMDELLRLGEEDDQDLDLDSDLWDLEQKLTAGDENAKDVVVGGGDASSSISLDAKEEHIMAGLETSLSPLEKENQQLEQQLNKMKLSKDSAAKDSMEPSTDDLLQRIQELETQLEAFKENDAIKKMEMKIKELERQNMELQHENGLLKCKDESVTGLKSKVVREVGVAELQAVVQNLQSRIMVLVEEKLELQLRHDKVEHELKGIRKQSENQGKRARWFPTPPSPKEKEVPSEPAVPLDLSVVSQSELLKEAMSKKKKFELPGALGGFLAKVASGDSAEDGSGKDPGETQEEKEAPHERVLKGLGIKSSSRRKTQIDEGASDKAGSPIHTTGASGWSIFGSLKTGNDTTQGDEEKFMSSTNGEKRDEQRLPPAVSTDALPSMIDSNSSSRENLMLEDEVVDFSIAQQLDPKANSAEEELFSPEGKTSISSGN